MSEQEPKKEHPSKLLEDAERGRQENYTNHLFALHHSEMPDWSEEVLRRVRGEVELPAPPTSSTTTATGEASSAGESRGA